MIVWPAKDPDELLDYSWTVPLDDGDTIAAFDAVLDSGSVSIADSNFTDTVATVWVSGGTDGETATFTLTVTTNGGRTFEKKAALEIIANSSTAAPLIEAFPRFAAVRAATIEYWLARAARSVDDTWCADDIEMGTMLMACHLMTLQGLGTGAEAEAAANGTGDYKTIRSGSVTLERFDHGAAAAQGELSSTAYGRQFAALARSNRGGPRVAASGTIPGYC